MALLLGVGNFSLAEMLSQVFGKLTDYASEEAARTAPMPPLLSTQKAVFVTVTTGGKTDVYLKTAADVYLIIQS